MTRLAPSLGVIMDKQKIVPHLGHNGPPAWSRVLGGGEW
jgi:hypothetical protein